MAFVKYAVVRYKSKADKSRSHNLKNFDYKNIVLNIYTYL